MTYNIHKMAKQQKPVAHNAADKERGSGLKLEIIGIAILAVGLYMAVSLASDVQGAEWGGVVGVYLAWTFTKLIGYTAYSLPLILIFISFGFLLQRIFAFRPAVPISFAVFMLSMSTLLAVLVGTQAAGGVIGYFLGGHITNLIGSTGSIIILPAIVLITIVIATGISFVSLGMRFLPALVFIAKKIIFIAKKIVGMDESPVVREDDDSPEEEQEDSAPQPRPQQYPAKNKAAGAPPMIHSKTRHKADDDDEKAALEFASPKGNFQLPSITLLDAPPEKTGAIDKKELLENTKILEKKLQDFGVDGRVLEVMPGPIVTMYEFEPAPGVKVNRITNLSDDLALAMKAMSIRIVAPIPGKSVVGIEIPNHKKDAICLKEMFEAAQFTKSRSRLSLALGKDISGSPYVADLARMPHLLIAGATGAGKSVAVNAMILSILYKATPEDVRFLMIDPKMLELSAYEGIPHLLAPVITDPKRAAGALKSIVSEMGKRYKSMAEKGAKNIEKYNQLIEDEAAPDDADLGNGRRKLPYIVVIIDELADLMMTSGKDVEECLVRLSQMARAAGIHLMVATQRPSVDVVTGLIKTNFPARIAFQLPSKTDSRTILDASGAETLLGQGDMLFLPPGTSKLQRIHGAYVSEAEIKKVTGFWKEQGTPSYDNVISSEASTETSEEKEDLGEEFMRRYTESVEMASQLEMISTSYIQRRLRIGYNTAARIIERMESEGVVGPAQGSRPREVLKR